MTVFYIIFLTSFKFLNIIFLYKKKKIVRHGHQRYYTTKDEDKVLYDNFICYRRNIYVLYLID